MRDFLPNAPGQLHHKMVLGKFPKRHTHAASALLSSPSFIMQANTRECSDACPNQGNPKQLPRTCVADIERVTKANIQAWRLINSLLDFTHVKPFSKTACNLASFLIFTLYYSNR
jgi:hypothetical protein